MVVILRCWFEYVAVLFAFVEHEQYCTFDLVWYDTNSK